jgi:hypothetical protein
MKYFILLLILSLSFISCEDDGQSVEFFNSSDLTKRINEHPESGQVIDTISAITNVGPLAFEMVSESHPGAFVLNDAIGEISVGLPEVFDFETNPVITAIVGVSNGFESRNINVTVTLNNLLVPLNGLNGFYPFNENANDESGKANHGIMEAASFSEDRSGEMNSAIDFTASGSKVDIGDLDFFSGQSNQFGISCWIKPGDDLSNSTLMAKLSQIVDCDEEEQEFIIRISNGILRSIYYENSSSSFRALEGNTMFTSNDWYHLVINYNGDNDSNDGVDRFNIYINGTKENLSLNGSAGAIPFGIENTNSHIGIGNRLKSNGEICTDTSFKGIIDDVALYTRMLEETEISLLGQDKY